LVKLQRTHRHKKNTSPQKEHIATKITQIDLKTKEINRLIGKKIPSTENKLPIYKAVIKPI
jgi:hypothetical protein